MADQPTYTRIPNAIIEAMPTLGNAELRVLLAIARKTVGWQKECDVISARQLAAMTGLTLRNTHAAIKSLVARGFIGQEAAGKQALCYRLKTVSLGDTDQNRIPSDTGTLGDTVPLPVGIQLEAKALPVGIQQKKESKEKKERDGSRVARTPPAPKQTNLDSFNPAIVIFKELSGKKQLAPTIITLIANRVTDVDKWRATIEGWAGCGYSVMNVNDMLDWYDHPEKMAQRLSRNNSKNAPAPIKSSGPPVASKPNIAPDALSREELAEAARNYRNGITPRTPTE